MKNRTRKLLSIVLASAMVFTLDVFSFAAPFSGGVLTDSTADKKAVTEGGITVEDANVTGEKKSYTDEDEEETTEYLSAIVNVDEGKAADTKVSAVLNDVDIDGLYLSFYEGESFHKLTTLTQTDKVTIDITRDDPYYVVDEELDGFKIWVPVGNLSENYINKGVDPDNEDSDDEDPDYGGLDVEGLEKIFNIEEDGKKVEGSGTGWSYTWGY